MAATGQATILDMREIEIPRRHSRFFETFDGLPSGESMILVNDHDPKPLFYQLSAERKGEFDWKALEEGPEVWRIAITKVGRGHEISQGTATGILKHEHEAIEKMLEVLSIFARKIESGQTIEAETLKKTLEFFRLFADKCHHGKEEAHLFPALGRKGFPTDGGPIGVMLMEHDHGRRFVKGMVEAVDSWETKGEESRKAFVQNAKRYVNLLRDHILKENNILFNMADESLTPEEQKALSLKFEEVEEKEMGHGEHERLHHVMDELIRIANA